MKRWVPAGILIALLILVGWSFRKGIFPNHSPETKTTPTRSDRKATSDQFNGGWAKDPEHLDGLEPRFHDTVRRLEKAHEEWLSQRPPYENWKVHEVEWEIESRDLVASLSLEELEALTVWVVEGGSLDFFVDTLLWSWGSRAPADVLAYLTTVIDDNRETMSTPHGLAGMNPYRDFFEECLYQGIAGIAELDAMQAWSALNEVESSGIEPLTNYLREEIMKCHARQNPEEAWEFIIGSADEKLSRWLISGYIAGIGGVANWPDFVAKLQEQEFARSRYGSGLSDRIKEQIARRWFMEKPDEALEWYSTNAEYSSVFAHRSGGLISYEGRVPEQEEAEVRIAADLLEYFIWEEGQEGIDSLSAWLARRLPEGDPTGIYFLEYRLSQEGDSPDTAWLIPLVAEMPKAEAERVYSELLKQIPARKSRVGNGLYEMTFESPNVILEAVKKLGDKLDLTPELRAEAEAAFRRVEEEELSPSD